jgi:hypothetical protein
LMLTKLAPALFIATLASAATAQDIGGNYFVKGTNLDGSPYEGTAVITWNSDVTCTINWTTGSRTSEGICMRDSNAFVAGYELQGKVGLVIYRVGDDGKLTGTWTVDGLSAVGTEVLTPM